MYTSQNSGIAADVFAASLANTHDHTFAEATRLSQQHDLTIFLDGYASNALMRCGMSKADLQRIGYNSQLDPAEKWRVLAPYWSAARVTGILNPQRIAMRDLYGVDELTSETALSLSQAIRANNKPGYTRRVLCERGNIHHCQLNTPLGESIFRDPCDDAYQLCDIRIFDLILVKNLDEHEKTTGISVHTLDDYRALIDWYFTRYGAKAVALKQQTNYLRAQDFGEPSKTEADASFNSILRKRDAATREERKDAEDWIFNHCLRHAASLDLPVKIHIGFTGGETLLEDVRPCRLEPTIARLPEVRFILLHAGYPFMHESVGLCMAHRNVYADLSWVWQLDPVAAQRMVERFITAVGPRQLLLFGGDTGYAEVSYGYSRVARQGLANALGKLRRNEYIRSSDVDYLISRLTLENARECFNLAGRFGL